MFDRMFLVPGYIYIHRTDTRVYLNGNQLQNLKGNFLITRYNLLAINPYKWFTLNLYNEGVAKHPPP